MYTCLAMARHWAHSFRISKFSSRKFVYCVPQRDFPFYFARGADRGWKITFSISRGFFIRFLQSPCSPKEPVVHTGWWQCQRRHSCYHAWLLAIIVVVTNWRRRQQRWRQVRYDHCQCQCEMYKWYVCHCEPLEMLRRIGNWRCNHKVRANNCSKRKTKEKDGTGLRGRLVAWSLSRVRLSQGVYAFKDRDNNNSATAITITITTIPITK